MRNRPPFSADHVGSLLRPKPLAEARAKAQKGELSAAQLKSVEDREIERIIRKQEEIGLQAVTDGEFRRSWWHLDFLAGLDGVAWYDMGQGIAFSGTETRAQGVRVMGKLGAAPHPMIEHFAFLRAHAARMPKITIPAPSALYGRTGPGAVKEVYPAREEFFADLGRAYKEVVRQFANAGCRYLQLDEVFIAMLCDDAYRKRVADWGDDPKRLGETFGDLINAAISDIPADMTVTMHLCRGNYRSTFMGSGGYEPVAEVLFDRIKVHGYFLEYDSARAGGFEPLRHLPRDRIAVLGLVTTKTGALETKDALKRRIEEAARFAALDRLALSPQCGFASTEEGNLLAEDEQWAKLRRVVEVAAEVWS